MGRTFLMLCKKEVFVMNILLLAFLVLGSNGTSFTVAPGKRSETVGVSFTLEWSYVIKDVPSNVIYSSIGFRRNPSGKIEPIYRLLVGGRVVNFTENFPTLFSSSVRVDSSSQVNSKNGTVRVKLHAVSLKNSGYYSCGLTAVLNEIERNEIQLIVSEPPSKPVINCTSWPTTFSGRNIAVKEGSNLSCSCVVIVGTPSPTIYWNTPTRKIYSSVYVSDKIFRSESGNYTCVAENGVGKENKTVHVDVQYAPTINMFMLSEQKSYIGQNISLRCTSDGNPKPTHQWKTPNLRANFRRSFVNGSSILHVNFNSFADFGNYTCLVNNSVGETNRSINFIQICPPGVIVFLENYTGPHNVELKWNASKYNGGSPIIDYYVTLTDGNENKSETTSKTRHSFENLIKNTTYMFCVQARNIVGFGNKTCINIKTYVATFPTSKFPSSTASGTPTERDKTANATSPMSEFASSTARGAPTERNKSKDYSNLTTIIIISVLLVLLVAVAVVFFILWMKRRAARGAPPAEPENHVAGPVNGELYAMVDNSNKSKKKAKNKSDLVYAELCDIPPAAQDEKPPSYQPTDYADISHILTPNADIVYSNVQPPCAQEGAYANVHDLNE